MDNNKTWLWLEDAPTTVSDIAQLLASNGIKTLRFSNPSDLVGFLLLEKQKGLFDYGLLIDVMLQGAQFISSPNAWNGGENIIFRTESGYDAGLVFVEQIILNKKGGWDPIWSKPLPPIVFITTLIEDGEHVQRLLDIKQAWAKHMNETLENVKVIWWRKWELNPTKYINLIKKW
jgi:hypothetical protein